jgi:DNA-binding NarL/FixJ family response regulator
MIKIAIADDHALVREGLKKVLKEESEFKVVAEAKNAYEVLELLEKTEVDLLLLDISMPGRSGLDVLGEIKNLHPKMPVLILSMHPEERFAIRAFKCGASGYMTKETAPEELINAVKKIIHGGKYVSASLAEKLVFEVHNNDKLKHDVLSNREFEVMCLIASGKTVKQIADELMLSVPTISTYRARILEKMNLHSNAEITYYAISNKLID